MAFTGDNRDRRAAAQAMLWSPLHPESDNAAFTVDDRKVIIGVYPIRITNVIIGGAVGLRGRHGVYGGQAPLLFGQFVPMIDKTASELPRV